MPSDEKVDRMRALRLVEKMMGATGGGMLQNNENQGTLEHPWVGDWQRGVDVGKSPISGWFMRRQCETCEQPWWALQRAVMPKSCGPCNRDKNRDMGRLKPR